jgi:adenine-specific DNA-methyltransferase
MVEQSVDSIKGERSNYDVLYEILLKYGLDLTYPISEHDINGIKVFNVAFGSLLVCLSDEITNETIVGIGEIKKELDSESTRVVIKDTSYKDSCDKLNAIETLKQYGITDVKCI